MKQIRLSLQDQVVALIYPETLQHDIEALFDAQPPILRLPTHRIRIREDGPERFSLQLDGATKFDGLCRDALTLALVGEAVQALITDITTGVVEHAGAVSWNGKGIIFPGKTGAGKSSMCAWLAQRGFEYLTDECVVLEPEVPRFRALRRPLVMKEGAVQLVQTEDPDQALVSGNSTIFWPRNAAQDDEPRACHLVLFPDFEQGSQIELTNLSAAQTALELMTCNVNARNLADHGFGIVTSFARAVPAVKLRYGGFHQLEEVMERLLDFVR